eukprot:1719723-Rhodomonas_salina.2
MDSDLALFNVTCQPCPQGTFKSGEGSGPCTSCPNAGAFSHSASTAPSDCIGGTPSVENRCAMRSHDRKEIKTTWCPFTADVLQFCDASLGPGKMNRYGHSMTAVQDFVVLFGGFAYQEGFEGWGSADNNFYVLDTASPRMQWLPVGKHAVKPAARFFHTAVVHDTQLIIYGGRGSAFEDMESIWVLDLRTLAWEPKTTSGSMPLDTAFPPMHTDAGLSKRYAHTSVMTSDSRMIVFGGTTMGVGSGCLADTWMLDVRTWTWTLLETAGTRLDLLARYAMSGGPTKLCWHSAAVSGSKMVVAGGYLDEGKSTASESVWELDLGSLEWAVVAETRGKQVKNAVIYQGQLAVVVGDYCLPSGCEIWSLDLESYAWSTRDVESNGMPTNLNIIESDTSSSSSS